MRALANRTRFALGTLVLMLGTLVFAIVWEAAAQQRRQRSVATPVPEGPVTAQSAPPTAAPAPVVLPRETVQADVSTRRIAVTSSFSGTGIIVFGAVDNSRQPTAESGLYDVVIVVVGTPTKLVARKKSKVAGIWLNTSSVGFDSVPSYYAIASTRPIEEIASEEVLKASAIGFEYAPMRLSKNAEQFSAAQIREFRDAVVRIKRKDRLFQKDEYAVAFVGKSLFRATIDVPANVTVGPFETRVFLFRDGELLSRYTARLNLEREGLESWIHAFAFGYPLFYGLATVLIAVGAGLIASTLFRKATH